MKKRGMSFDDCLKLVRLKRTFVSPNVGFEKQLRAFEFVALGNTDAKAAFDKFMDQSAPRCRIVAPNGDVQEFPEHKGSQASELDANILIVPANE